METMNDIQMNEVIFKTHQRLFEFVRLDASDKEGIALAEGGHEELKTLLEL